MRGLGLPFVCVNQEYDPSQWEINTRYDDVLAAADDAHLLKLTIKEVAAMHGLVATFMGRPMEGGTSGYHLHISAVDEQGANVFDDPAGEHGLSDLARWFIGGVLAHGRGTTAVMAPTVNAYRRFIAQELAPYWINWGPDNRSVYVRIPIDRGKSARIECRGADGTASAYLASAVEIFAGLVVPVASVPHLIALKVLARDDRNRPQDLTDLRQLLEVAVPGDVGRAREALVRISELGFHRNRDLLKALDEILARQ